MGNGLYMIAGLLSGMAQANARKQALQDRMNQWAQERQINQQITPYQQAEIDARKAELALQQSNAANKQPALTYEQKAKFQNDEYEQHKIIDQKYAKKNATEIKNELVTSTAPIVNRIYGDASMHSQTKKAKLTPTEFYDHVDTALSSPQASSLDAPTMDYVRKAAYQRTHGLVDWGNTPQPTEQPFNLDGSVSAPAGGTQ